MRKLQGSLWVKLIAVAVLLASVYGAGVFGAYVLLAMPYLGASDWQDTIAFTRLLEARERQVAELVAYRQALEAEDLPYTTVQRYQQRLEELEQQLQASATWFRYQVRNSEGTVVHGGNLAEGEDLAETVRNVNYATFTAGEHYVEEIEGGIYWSYTVTESERDTAGETEVVQQAAPTLVIECGVAADVDGAIPDEFYQLSMDDAVYRGGFDEAVTGLLDISALALLALCLLLWTAGHRAGEEGVVLTWQEKIFTEGYLLAAGCAGFVLLLCGAELGNFLTGIPYRGAEEQAYLPLVRDFLLPATAVALIVVAALTLRTLVVRLKANCLARTTLLCRVVTWMAKAIHDFVKSLPFTWKAVCGFGIYFLINLWLVMEARYSDMFQFFCFLLNGAVLLFLGWWSMGFYRLRKGTKTIAGGDLDFQIDTHRMPQDLRLQAEDLNNISVGLSGAVEEKMKSERFKAELITNVSHDLKTPLTSIINYVNLLKATEQTDPKALEYIEVLDRKSQRLKKLTEDLVEASKASTGVLAVNREKISLSQLVDQALGEWAEKLADKKLTVVVGLPEGETWVYADGRHLWRVIDNLLSNCAKYAMEGTRVYLDLERGKGQVSLSVKNISREALNVPPERLMERFVRGEESRTTEGSGLGLSIARSLTELQGGEFALAVDGDLFKATVTLPQAN